MGSIVNNNLKVNRRGKPRNRIGYLRKLTCKRNLGKIVINDDKYCLDQISDEENIWFYRKESYLMETYGITLQHTIICACMDLYSELLYVSIVEMNFNLEN